MNFEEIINSIREKIGETNSALVSDELVSLASLNKGQSDDINKLNNDIKELKSTNDELLKVNGKLFQRIGFEKKEEEKNKDEEKKINLSDLINEKGDFI